MRLTLRTLLAYLDDTLQATEIKEIGQKVAESDAAQELIARLKAVTRRRRLTAPTATGPNALDPNRVAAYLDNELGSEELAELEKLALESDVHLAEIAACHQILTLVLGEPALVPPTAKERMYSLVNGREAVPARKAAPAKKSADGLEEEDDALGLTGGKLKWVLPAAGLLLVVALGLAVYQVLPPRETRQSRVERKANEGVKEEAPGGSKVEKDVKTTPVVEKEKDKSKGEAPVPADKDKGKVVTPIDPVKTKKDPTVVDRTSPPLTDRVETGQYAGAFGVKQPSVLVQRRRPSEREATTPWQRVDLNGTIHTDDVLAALPGYTAVVRTRNGAGLLLRGNTREFSIHPFQDFLAESTVQLHKNDKFDLDMTLLRGRVYISNRKPKDEGKGELKVRLRFEAEVWDLVLERDTEVGFDLVKRYTPGVNYRTDDEPRATLGMCLFRGEMELKVDAFQTRNLDPEGKVMIMVWDSFTKAGDPVRIDRAPAIWSKMPPNPADDNLSSARRTILKQMNAALFNLDTLLSGKKGVDIALKESLTQSEIASRMLAIYSLGAIDDTSKLIDVMGDENTEHRADREAAVFTLRLWLSRGAAQGKELFNLKDRTGVLIDKKYKPREAETIYDLLHDFQPEDWSKAETFEALARSLQHRKTAVAELAYFHLQQLALGAKLPPGFNAASPVEDRERYAMLITDMITKKLLPPAPPTTERPKGK